MAKYMKQIMALSIGMQVCAMEESKTPVIKALQFNTNYDLPTEHPKVTTAITQFYNYLKEPDDSELCMIKLDESDNDLVNFVDYNRPLITLYGCDTKVSKDKSKMIMPGLVLKNPTESIEEIALDQNTIKYTRWEKEKKNKVTVKKTHSVNLVGNSIQGSSLCMRDQNYGFYIGCNDGTLQKLDGNLQKVSLIYRAHTQPIIYTKTLGKRMLLTRTAQECYIWNQLGDQRPRLHLENIGEKSNKQTSNIYIDHSGRDLSLICSHAGSPSILSSSFDNDLVYTIPHFWATGENCSNLDPIKALYIYGLGLLAKTSNPTDNIGEDFSGKDAIPAFRNSPIIKTFEKEVTIAIDKFLDEKEAQFTVKN